MPMYNGELEDQCKNIAPSDKDDFTKRMRFHQSWYRRYVLGLPPGPNPQARMELYGNMLRPEDGDEGWNFLTNDIHQYVTGRLDTKSRVIEPNRMRNNLLSSQPMCFNLFVPLRLDLNLAYRLIASLKGFGNIAKVTRVEMEYAPPKQNLLNDGSSFDAWVEYQRTDGDFGFIGIETKLTEPFTGTYCSFNQYYGKWIYNPNTWWKSGAEVNFSTKSYNQLWRNHLLAFALQHQPQRQYRESFSVVLSHPKNQECHEAIDSYCENLLPRYSASLFRWSLPDLVNLWFEKAQSRQEKSWLQAFRLRYLDLEASERDWQNRGEYNAIRHQ